jgi:hypothetical protein
MKDYMIVIINIVINIILTLLIVIMVNKKYIDSKKLENTISVQNLKLKDTVEVQNKTLDNEIIKIMNNIDKNFIYLYLNFINKDLRKLFITLNFFNEHLIDNDISGIKINSTRNIRIKGKIDDDFAPFRKISFSEIEKIKEIITNFKKEHMQNMEITYYFFCDKEEGKKKVISPSQIYQPHSVVFLIISNKTNIEFEIFKKIGTNLTIVIPIMCN